MIDAARIAVGAAQLRLRRPETARWLARLRAEASLPRAEMRARQTARLATLLEHAARHVPYWRDWFAGAGLAPADAVDPDRFRRLPVMTRRLLQDGGERLWSDDHVARDSYLNSSGGSTGQPVRVRQDRAYADAVHAAKLLWDEWAGYRLGASKAVVWGSERDLFHGQETLRGRLKRWVRGEHWLNAFRMTPVEMDAFLDRLEAAPPRLLLGYANSLYELAAHAERTGRRIEGVGAVMSSASTLFPAYRTTIRRVFGAPVFDRYGCREVGDPAGEGPSHAGAHVCESLYVVEVLRDDDTPCEPGETGRLVVTCLVNFSMPMIRYDIGDVAAWHESDAPSDGVSWRRLREIGGRAIETIVRPDGGVVSPMYFIHLLGVTLERGWIARFQFVQDRPEALRVRLVLRDPVADPATVHAAALDEIATKVRQAIGDGVAVAFEFPSEIPPSASGKYRYVISNVRTGPDDGR